MQKSKYILILLLLVGLVACYYHPDLPADGTSENKTDSVPEALHKRAYALSSNFEVEADTLWLHQLPFMDTIPVVKGNQLVVAEFDVHPQDSVDSVWVKVARDQETIGWIQEHKLLENIVPMILFAVYSFVQQFAYLAFLSGAGRILSMVCLSGSTEETD